MRVDFFNLWRDKFLQHSTVLQIFQAAYTKSGGGDSGLITVWEFFITLLNFQMRVQHANHKRLAKKPQIP